MTRDDIRRAVLRSLSQVAPEVAAASIGPTDEIRDAADLDSVDYLNFILGLHAELGVDVPESDYAKLATLEASVAYLASRLGIS